METRKKITIDGKLRSDILQAIMKAWVENHPIQNNSMAIQAANAAIDVLLKA